MVVVHARSAVPVLGAPDSTQTDMAPGATYTAPVSVVHRGVTRIA